MARKPLLIAAYSWAGSILGPEKLRRILESFIRLQLRMPGPRGTLLRIYARVLGRAPSREEAARYLDGVGARFSDTLASLYTLDALPAAARAALVDVPALETIEALRRRGRGVILASPHFGNVPLALAGLAARGVPLTVSFVNGAPYRWCEDAFGFKVVTLGGGAVDYWKALKANEVVVVYCDLDFFPENRTAAFFGAPVRPPHGVARLARASGAPVLPVYEVLENGRHRVEADAPLEPELPAEALEDALLRSMERAIRARPEHWLVLRDIWDVEGTDRANRRHLQALKRFGPMLDF